MAVMIQNSLDRSIVWDPSKPGESTYDVSLKWTEIGSKNLYIWDATNDAYASFNWRRCAEFSDVSTHSIHHLQAGRQACACAG